MNVNEAIAAVKANPPLNPLPWREDDSVVRSANSNAVAQWAEWADAAHIAATVNAAPILIAEVERLQAALAAARVAAGNLPPYPHTQLRCSPSEGCHCTSDASNTARIEARRALGLEPMPAPPEPQAVRER